MINLPLSLKSPETPMHKGTEPSERIFWPLTHLSLDLSLYQKSQYVGDVLRVRGRRTRSTSTTYFFQSDVPQFFLSRIKC